MTAAAALLSALLSCASPASAQIFPDASGQSSDAALTAALDRKHKSHEEPAPVAQAISLAFGATFFNEVRVSTNGPVVDLSRLSHEGFYKLELIELLLIGAKSRTPLAELAQLRRKDKSLRAIAASHGVDFDAMYDSALAVQEIVDRDYLPRFPERRPHKERDEP